MSKPPVTRELIKKGFYILPSVTVTALAFMRSTDLPELGTDIVAYRFSRIDNKSKLILP